MVLSLLAEGLLSWADQRNIAESDKTLQQFSVVNIWILVTVQSLQAMLGTLSPRVEKLPT